MIFRAMVGAYPKGLPERCQDERVVFIEAANRDDARARLPVLASTAWRVPVESLEICNLEPEFELITSPLAEGLPREHAMFVIGWGDGKPTFVNGQSPCGHAVFFLAREIDRVMNAYMSLPREAAADM
jgi:hypothetical protein